MTKIDDMRKTIEASFGNLTPTRAQELAKGLLEKGAAKEQVAKSAADLLDWSHRNRERLRDFVRHEITSQLHQMGVATHTDLDAIKKRVRDLERAAGMTASGRARTSKKPTSRKKTGAKKTAARKAPTTGPTAAKAD